jgi:hypothetical protein
MAQLKPPPPKTTPSPKRPVQRPQAPARVALREGIIAGIAIAAIDMVASRQVASLSGDTATSAALQLLDLLATMFLFVVAGFRAGSAAASLDSTLPLRVPALLVLSPSSRTGLIAGTLAGVLAALLNSVDLLFVRQGGLPGEGGDSAGIFAGLALLLLNVPLGMLLGYTSGWLAGMFRWPAR